MKKIFGKSELEEFFSKLGALLSEPVEVFLLGGGAMAFRNQKNATKDLDLVFENEETSKLFCTAISRLGFTERKKFEITFEYAKMQALGGFGIV